MKFSTNSYIFYPDNSALEQALEHYQRLIPDDVAEAIRPDNNVTVPDNFIHTRGNFEQHRFSNNVLDNAKIVFESALTDDLRQQAPADWAEMQNSLGNVLAAIGQQQRDDELLRDAIGAFSQALETINREDDPLAWAATQYNLGTTMQALGRQNSDAKLLNKAGDAYTEALLEWTREKTPFEWAMTMHQLGATFHAQGKLLKGNRVLQKSVVAYKNALSGFDADNAALELASAHNNRGVVLQHLGESEDNANRLEESIRSYEKGLAVSMEQQLPIHLAVMCRVNRATARGVLAELTRDPVSAEEAADEFDLIIETFRPNCQPLCLKHCESQLEHLQSLARQLGVSA